MKKIMFRIMIALLVVFSVLGIGVYFDSKRETKVSDNVMYDTGWYTNEYGNEERVQFGVINLNE